MGIAIRRAVPSDTAAACELVRSSIAELCVVDHRGDESTIIEWLANKTTENFAGWISSSRHVALVAESADAIAGFVLLNRNGTIALLYVAPQFRFRGVSKALLASVEEHAVALGVAELKLESSATALSFYERCGYSRAAETVQGFGVTHAYPLSKSLHTEMSRSTDEVVVVLGRVKELLAESDASNWAALAPAEVTRILEREMKSLVDTGQFHDKTELTSLFAPTAEIQEIALANRWSDEYIRLSSALDAAARNIE